MLQWCNGGNVKKSKKPNQIQSMTESPANGSCSGKRNTAAPSLPMHLSRRSSLCSLARLPSPCTPFREAAPYLWLNIRRPMRSAGWASQLWAALGGGHSGVPPPPSDFLQLSWDAGVAPSLCPEAMEMAAGGADMLWADDAVARGSGGAQVVPW